MSTSRPFEAQDHHLTSAFSGLGLSATSRKVAPTMHTHDPTPRRRWYNSLGSLLKGRSERAATHYHHGDIYNTMNIHNAPVTTIHHANNVNLIADDDLLLLQSLPKHPDISGQWSEYLKNSRNRDMQEIWRWIDAPGSSELVLWVHGPAGLGKSTLARELMHDLGSQGRLAASIFLSQLPTDSWGPETVIRLISAEIGRIHRRAIPAIATAVRQCHNATLELQVQMFIRNPLLSLGPLQPLVVVVDAIDEWRSHHNFVKELAHLSPHYSLVRFIILGRLEPRARRFQNVPIRPYHLLPVSVEVMKDYLNSRFQRIDWEFGRRPVAQDVLRLAEMADGLFVWVATVCSLLERRTTGPWAALTAILHSRRNVGESDGLVKLYHSAISLLFPDPEERDALKDFLGFAMLLQEPLPLDTFVLLTGLNRHVSLNILSDLKALQIRRPVDSQTMVHPASTIFHMSLIEYLQSTSTPAEVAFPILSTPYHSRLGGACLQAVINLPPASPPPNGLYLPPTSRYAIVFWMWHIAKGIPLVEPYSDIDWNKTPCSAVLRDPHTFTKLCRWADPFVKSLQPDSPSLPTGEDVGSLMQSVASSLHVTVETATLFKIPCLEIAVRVSPDDPKSWRRLGLAYDDLVKITDSTEPLRHSVAAHQQAVNISKQDQLGNHETYVRALANSIFSRGQRLRDMEDLETAIALQKEVLDLCPPGHTHRSTSLAHLANSLYLRFQRTRSTDDLEESIMLHKEQLALLTPGDPSTRSLTLNSLAAGIFARYEGSGSVGYLDEAISLQREAVTLMPSGHPSRWITLYNLASVLHSHYQETGHAYDVEEAVSLARGALALNPPGHPDRPLSLSNLSLFLRDQFKESGSTGDIEEVVALDREVLALQPTGHPDRPDSLGYLASSLSDRFGKLGLLEDLEEVISLRREVLAHHPLGAQTRSELVEGLISSIDTHFELVGLVDDLDEIITLGRELISLCPMELDPLRNQSEYLHTRFGIKGATQDLQEALALAEEALPLCSPYDTGYKELSDWILSYKEELARVNPAVRD